MLRCHILGNPHVLIQFSNTHYYYVSDLDWNVLTRLNTTYERRKQVSTIYDVADASIFHLRKFLLPGVPFNTLGPPTS